MTEPVAGRKPVLALPIRLLSAAVLVLSAFGVQAAVVLTSLQSFQAFTDGAYPQAGLAQGSDGYFYGTTSEGGSNPNGAGSVFKISTNGVLTSLYAFTGGNDGGYPYRRAGAGQRRQFLWNDLAARMPMARCSKSAAVGR